MMFCFELILMDLLKIKNKCYSETFLMRKSLIFIYFLMVVLILRDLLLILVLIFLLKIKINMQYSFCLAPIAIEIHEEIVTYHEKTLTSSQ